MATITLKSKAVVRFEQSPIEISVTGDESEGVDSLLNHLHETVKFVGDSEVSKEILDTIAGQNRRLVTPVSTPQAGPTRKSIAEPPRNDWNYQNNEEIPIPSGFR